MTHTMTWTDRLRIERAVWTVDSYLQGLPWRSRVAKRRELRDNLYAAAADVGTVEALRRLGNWRRLAGEYLSAEYGEWGQRPSWLAGFTFILLANLFLGWLLDAETSAFSAGVTAAHPHPTGIFHWHGMAHVLNEVTFTFVNGQSTAVGGAWTPLVYVCLFAGAVLAGRLWRLLPAWRRHQSKTTDGP